MKTATTLRYVVGDLPGTVGDARRHPDHSWGLNCEACWTVLYFGDGVYEDLCHGAPLICPKCAEQVGSSGRVK